MALIIAAHFDHIEQLEYAIVRLNAAGYDPRDYARYLLNPPGQHGLFPLGGDAAADEGARDAGKGAAVGAAVGGAAGALLGSVAGPAGVLAGAGVGAYVGSLGGALNTLEDPDPERATRSAPAMPQGGPMLAVCTARHGTEAEVIDILSTASAHTVVRAQGTWGEAGWLDYDPREPMETVDPASRRLRYGT